MQLNPKNTRSSEEKPRKALKTQDMWKNPGLAPLAK